MPGHRSHLPTLIRTRSTVVHKVEHTIFNPARLRPAALLAKSRVDSSPTSSSLRYEGILLAFSLCLTSRMAVVHTVHVDFVFIAEIVPFRFVAGHHLGQDVIFEHVAVCQHI
jgi:hypothetical protein